MANLSNPLLVGYQNLKLKASKVILLEKDNYKLATNIFQEYTCFNLKDSLFWDAINIDFQY